MFCDNYLDEMGSVLIGPKQKHQPMLPIIMNQSTESVDRAVCPISIGLFSLPQAIIIGFCKQHRST